MRRGGTLTHSVIEGLRLMEDLPFSSLGFRGHLEVNMEPPDEREESGKCTSSSEISQLGNDTHHFYSHSIGRN